MLFLAFKGVIELGNKCNSLEIFLEAAGNFPKHKFEEVFPKSNLHVINQLGNSELPKTLFEGNRSLIRFSNPKGTGKVMQHARTPEHAQTRTHAHLHARRPALAHREMKLNVADPFHLCDGYRQRLERFPISTT